VPRRIFRPKRDEVTRGWKKLHNEPRDLYSSPSIIRIYRVKENMMGGACGAKGRKGTCVDYWWENQTERDN
jgi:hypothetical protein